MPDYLSPAILAEELGLPLSTIWKACRAGVLPHVRIGRHIRIKRTDFEAWWESNKKSSQKAS